MAPTLSKVEPLRLACPFALCNQEHYKGNLKSNCTTLVGFGDRQLLRQHIISQHLALCPRCFEPKTTDKNTPDKNLAQVLAWRRTHIPTCRPEGRPRTLPPGKFTVSEAQVLAFERFDKEPILGAVKDKKQQEFLWWTSLFQALYPRATKIPKPDTSFYVARLDVEKEVKKALDQQLVEIAEKLVHGALIGQVGLPNGVRPDASKYQQLGSLIDLLSKSPRLDAMPRDPNFQEQLNNMLKTISQGPELSDSGYDSFPGSDPMEIDEGVRVTGTEQTDLMGLGEGTGTLDRGRDRFDQDADGVLKPPRRRW